MTPTTKPSASTPTSAAPRFTFEAKGDVMTDRGNRVSSGRLDVKAGLETLRFEMAGHMLQGALTSGELELTSFSASGATQSGALRLGRGGRPERARFELSSESVRGELGIRVAERCGELRLSARGAGERRLEIFGNVAGRDGLLGAATIEARLDDTRRAELSVRRSNGGLELSFNARYEH